VLIVVDENALLIPGRGYVGGVLLVSGWEYTGELVLVPG
jgi:hypothetical protein